ncbi:hypothetical protein QQF64_015736, partial [Cirrhinus molitorella]
QIRKRSGEREGGRVGKGPRAGNRTRDARCAMALYVGALPTRISVPTAPQLFESEDDGMSL